VLVGFYDLFSKAKDEPNSPPEVDAEFSLLDLRVRELKGTDLFGSIVKEINVDSVCGLVINFDRGYSLGVFPMSSLNQDSEHWRYGCNLLDQSHLIVSNIDIEFPEPLHDIPPTG
jgi:hypothetical protein